MDLFCPHCGATITEQTYFCPTCGQKIRARPEPTTVGRQIVVYLVSILLPPLGLWPGVNYLRQKDPKARKIGWIAIALTILSLIISTWLLVKLVNNIDQSIEAGFNDSLNNLGS